MHVFGDELAIAGRTAFDESLRFIDESVWKGVAADVADGKGLTLFLEDEFNAAWEVANAAGRHRSGQAHAVIARGALQGLVFRDGVVVAFAFAVAEPGEECQGDYDDPDTDAEFRASLHKSPLMHAVQFE